MSGDKKAINFADVFSTAERRFKLTKDNFRGEKVSFTINGQEILSKRYSFGKEQPEKPSGVDIESLDSANVGTEEE